MILASQFNSFAHPLTVLAALPFSLSGALLALRLAGLSLNLYSFIGIILLMGIVKKNSILLVDFANQRRLLGDDRNAALLHACPQRLRPILMTSIATIAGALPAALAAGPGGELRQPMALAVVGGTALSTLLTLYVVPSLYSVFDTLTARISSAARIERDATQVLADLQSEEIIYSNDQLEKKFAELETRIEQLSLLTDLSAAVSATLDPEKIYDQTLTRLVHRMGYQNAFLSLVDRRRDVLRGYRMAGVATGGPEFEGLELPLDATANASARAVLTGQPVRVDDVDRASEPVHLELAILAAGIRHDRRDFREVNWHDASAHDHPDTTRVVPVRRQTAILDRQAGGADGEPGRPTHDLL